MKKGSLIIIALVIVALIGVVVWQQQKGKMGETPITETMISLEAENDSNQMGTAKLKDVNGKLEVSVELTGVPAEASEPAHIHMGTCEALGEVKYPLSAITADGITVTTLENVKLADILNGEYAISVHKSETELDARVACGNIVKPAEDTTETPATTDTETPDETETPSEDAE